MFTALGHAPLCLELDLDSYEGPRHHVSRFRGRWGWLMVVECTIQSEHDIMTAELVVACDEHDNPVPSFQARHLTKCHWADLTYCDEPPPEILEDMICEEEGALLARWHREKNADLAAAFEGQEARIAELEGRVQAMIRRNNAQIADLRRRRRHPAITFEERDLMSEVIGELDAANEDLLLEMAETRTAIRERANALEDELWSREDLLVEAETLHVIRWEAEGSSKLAVPRNRSFHHGPSRKSAAQQMEERDAVRAERRSRAPGQADFITADIANILPPPFAPAETDQEAAIEASEASEDVEETSATAERLPLGQPSSRWTTERLTLLHDLWMAGVPATEIAERIGIGTRNNVIGKAYRLNLPKRDPVTHLPIDEASNEECVDKLTSIDVPAGVTIPSPWTEDKIEILKTLWLQGMTANNIARALGGFSRNAVIGKAKRLALPMGKKLVDVPESTGPVVQDALARLAAARARYYGTGE